MKEKPSIKNYNHELIEDNIIVNIKKVDRDLYPFDSEGLDSKYSKLMVIAALMVQFALFGTAGAFDAYVETYLNTEFNSESSTLVAFIDYLGSGVYIIPCIPAGILVSKFGYRLIMLIGALLSGFGLILASFTVHIWLLLLNQAVLFGIVTSACFIPLLVLYLNGLKKNRVMGRYFPSGLEL